MVLNFLRLKFRVNPGRTRFNKYFGIWQIECLVINASNEVLCERYCGNFEIITFLGEFDKGALLEAL